MEQLIQAFGIDVKLITVQIINFLVLMGLLTYFLYKPVLKLLEEREATVVKSIADAEAAAQAKAEAHDEKQSILTTAHQEAEAVTARAKTAADEKSDTIISDAEEKAAAIARLAEEKGEEIKAQAHKDSEAEIAKLAILAAEKVLQERTS